MGVLPTDDSPKFEWDSASGAGAAVSATLMGVVDANKTFHDTADDETGLVGLVLDKTSFYAEAGGQVCGLRILVQRCPVRLSDSTSSFL